MSSLPTALTATVSEQIKLKTILKDANGLAASSTVSWSSSDTTIAVVNTVWNDSTTAFVNCIAAGTATITATSNGHSATFSLTVNASSAGGDTNSIDVVADTSFQNVKQMA